MRPRSKPLTKKQLIDGPKRHTKMRTRMLPEVYAIRIEYGHNDMRLVELNCGCTMYFPNRHTNRVIGPEYCHEHDSDSGNQLLAKTIAHKAIR
jgi:hypothetical protein